MEIPVPGKEAFLVQEKNSRVYDPHTTAYNPILTFLDPPYAVQKPSSLFDSIILHPLSVVRAVLSSSASPMTFAVDVNFRSLSVYTFVTNTNGI